MDTVVWTVALMAAVGLVGSVLLLIVSRKLAIGEDERLTYLMSILPGVNCGACGHPGCEQYAKAMMNGAPPNACTTGGDRVAQALAAYLGVESTGVVQREAFVACQGSLDHIDPQLVFKGVSSCRVFSTLSYSSLSCPFGCLGYGDCAEACPFDAIVVENGVARIDTAACTGCGTCAKICPRGIISMVDQAAANRLRGDVQEHHGGRQNAQGVQRGLHRLPEVRENLPHPVDHRGEQPRAHRHGHVHRLRNVHRSVPDPCHQQTGVPVMPW